MQYSRILRIVVLLMFAALLVTPVAAQDTAHFRAHISTDPATMDPHMSPSPTTTPFLFQIYDTLLYRDDDGNIQPHLATDYTISDDGLTLTFTLRDDVEFSDGSPLNADAVIFTFERAKQIGQRSPLYTNVIAIERMEKIDDYTVVFHLIEPSADLIDRLASPYAGILSPSAVAAAGDDYFRNPVGSGPFMLGEWVPDSYLTLVPNPNYSGHRAWEGDAPMMLDVVQYDFINDADAVTNALMAGQLHSGRVNLQEQIQRLEADPDFTMMSYPLDGLYFIGFNVNRAPFNQVEARQALAQGLDLDTAVLLATNGNIERTATPLPETMMGYDPALAAEAPAYDPAAAAASLADLGISPGDRQPLTIITSPSSDLVIPATVIQQQLAQLGFDAEIEILDFRAIRERAASGDWDLYFSAYFATDPDILRQMFATDGVTNRIGYTNPAFDDLVYRARATYDLDERAQLYAAAQRALMDDFAILPLYQPAGYLAVSSAVQGMNLLRSAPIYAGVTLEN